jgi:hypothetical protein
MVTTTSPVGVTTGTAVKTMLQLATPSSRKLSVVSWGYSLDSPPNTSVSVVELLQTNVAATVTAHVAAGVQPLDPGQTASLLTLSVSGTGYTASAEGTITAARSLDTVQIAGGTSTATLGLSYSYQFMPDEQPQVAASSFLRVRVDMSTAVNMLCWIVFEE